jgi:hypothetical protein
MIAQSFPELDPAVDKKVVRVVVHAAPIVVVDTVEVLGL